MVSAPRGDFECKQTEIQDDLSEIDLANRNGRCVIIVDQAVSVIGCAIKQSGIKQNNN